MHKHVGYAIIGALAVALVGCSSTAHVVSEDDSQARGFANVEEESTLLSEEDNEFVTTARDLLNVDPANNQAGEIDDASLVTIGHEACDTYDAAEASGETRPNIYGFELVEGETPVNGFYWTSGQIALAAAQVYCPEHAPQESAPTS